MTEETTARPPLGRRFTTLWAGQTASLLGSQVSSAGVSIAAFVETGSVWWLSILYLAIRVPGMLAASHAGDLVDRSDRRRVLVLADTAAAVATGTALLLLATGHLELWHLVVVAVVGATANAYHEPAYASALPLLVPRAAIDRAQGMLQLGPAVGVLAGPAIAGVLVGTGGIGAVLLFDAATFVLAIATASRVVIPRPDSTATAATDDTDLRGLRATWDGLTGRLHGLRHLLLYSASMNLVISIVNVLLFALLVPLAGEAGAGLLLSLGGAGMLVTAGVVAARGVPARRVRTMAGSAMAIGVGIVLMGLRPSPALVATGLVVTLAAAALLSGASGTLFQTEVAADRQGRLSSLRRVMAEGLMPLAVLAAAPLAEGLAGPAMADGGPLAGSVGLVLGTGPGRGAALLFVVIGLVVVGLGVLIARDRALRVLDRAEPLPVDAPVSPVDAGSPSALPAR